MQWHRRLLWIFVLAALAMGSAWASTYPEPVGYVNDFAGVLSPQTKHDIDALLTSLKMTTGAEMAVVTLPSLNDEPVENVASDLFKQWGIGQKGRDSGLLFLIAPNERKMRFEVGYGLEPILPDAATGRIMDEYVVPAFRKGDLDTGILQGTQATAQLIAKKYEVELDTGSLEKIPTPQEVRQLREKKTLGDYILQLLLIIVAVILFIRYPRLFFLFWMLGGGGGGRSSGGFGGGFGGFGGGSSGGGGSSRSW